MCGLVVGTRHVGGCGTGCVGWWVGLGVCVGG